MPTRLDDRPAQRAGLEFALDLWTRRKWVALPIFGAIVAATASVAVSLPDIYRATATVLVEAQHVSEEFVRSSVSAGLEARIQTIREEVMSRARLGALITRLDLYPEARLKGVAFDDIIERMRRDIDLDLNLQPTGGRTSTISFAIKYTGRDPRTVAQVANMLASLYVAENSRIREGQAVKTAEFLKTQLDDVKKEMDAQEQRVTEFNLSHMGELPQQVAANLASLERLNTQLRLNGENQVHALDRRDRLEKQLADAASALPVAPAPGPGRSSGADEVLKLKQQLEQLSRKYTDQYPEVIRVRAELVALERQVAERVVPVAAPAPAATTTVAAADPKTRLAQAIIDVDAELKALKDEELAFRQAISSYELRVENVPKRQEEFQALTRDTATTKERYNTLLTRYEEAQLASSLEQGQKVEQFRILDAAIPPRDPAAPNRVRLFAIGFVLAIALAVGSILLMEKVDTTFHSIEDLRAFVPVRTLFSIPLIHTMTDTRRQWRRVALAAVSIAIALTLIISGARHLARNNEALVRLTAGAHS